MERSVQPKAWVGAVVCLQPVCSDGGLERGDLEGKALACVHRTQFVKLPQCFRLIHTFLYVGPDLKMIETNNLFLLIFQKKPVN